MPAIKDDIAAAIHTARDEVAQIVASAAESAWSNPVYEGGWTAKHVLCHLAITAGVPSLLIGLAATPRAETPISVAGSPDIDDLNDRMIASLLNLPAAVVLQQIRANYDRGLRDLEGSTDALLSQGLRTPWGTEGTLRELLLVEDLRDHVMVHIRDLAEAVRS